MQCQHRITEYHHSPQPSFLKGRVSADCCFAPRSLVFWSCRCMHAANSFAASRFRCPPHLFPRIGQRPFEPKYSKDTGMPSACQEHNLKASSPSTVSMSDSCRLHCSKLHSMRPVLLEGRFQDKPLPSFPWFGRIGRRCWFPGAGQS
jgi:hypothetical protein